MKTLRLRTDIDGKRHHVCPRAMDKLSERLLERYKERFENIDIERYIERSRTHTSSAKCAGKGMLFTPMAKLLQLYGIDELNEHTKAVVNASEKFKFEYPKLGKASETLSWAAIGFGLAQLGGSISDSISFLGAAVSSSIGYTVSLIHPSVIGMIANKIEHRKKEVGIGEYLRTVAIADMPAMPIYLTAFSSVIHLNGSGEVSAITALSAVLLSCFISSVVYNVGFAIYWANGIRKQVGNGITDNAMKFANGFLHPLREEVCEDAYHEAGKILGIALFVLMLPTYAFRIACATGIALSGIYVHDFVGVFFSIGGMLGLVFEIPNGIVKTKVSELIKRNNEAFQSDGRKEREKEQA